MIKQPEVVIQKVRQGNEVSLPPFIGLFHRHFQKALPKVASQESAIVTAPVDLLDLILPDRLLDQIESIEVVYKK